MVKTKIINPAYQAKQLRMLPDEALARLGDEQMRYYVALGTIAFAKIKDLDEARARAREALK